MFVTAQEFQQNCNKYLELLEQEDIIITKEGQNFATLTRNRKPLSEFEELREDYIKIFGEQPDERREQLMHELTDTDAKVNLSAVEYLSGLLADKNPPDWDKKQIREMRLAERYDSDNA